MESSSYMHVQIKSNYYTRVQHNIIVIIIMLAFQSYARSFVYHFSISFFNLTKPMQLLRLCAIIIRAARRLRR